MRIVVDLQGTQSESRFRGIGRYSLSLALAMARNAGPHEILFALNAGFPDTVSSVCSALEGLVPRENIRCFHVVQPNAEMEPHNKWRTLAAERMRETFLADLCPDMVFVSSLFEGVAADIPVSVGVQCPELITAVTLYDLIPFLNPEIYLCGDLVKNWYGRRLKSLQNANLLLSISDYSKQEAVEALGIEADRIVPISSAASEAFQPISLTDEDRQSLFDRYGVDGAFIMYSGAFDERKNVDRLFEAFAMLPADVQERHCLLCAGRIKEPKRQHLTRLADRLGIGGSIRLPGFVPDEDLIALYSTCALFIFPSLSEGFGLPPLEAMSCGAPTIGANATSIPEVIGAPEALFSPLNVEEMTALMHRTLTDGAFNRFLREHGQQQAKKFSWDKSARKALDAMETMARRVTERSTAGSGRSQRQSSRLRHKALIDALSGLTEAYTDNDLRAAARAIHANRRATASAVHLAVNLPPVISWRIEGPFDSTYSLALLNRETARALAAFGHDVALHSTDGPGDFPPNQDFLRANPDLAAMHRRGLEVPALDSHVASRNLYPPRVHDMTAELNLLHHYAWEETGFPREWADSFNESLQGITCLSRHVEKILVDAGVTIPMTTSGCGVDHWERVQADGQFLLAAKTFRFLHVSSCFPRKGIDALLDAYGKAFTDADDVSLVIKTFPNPHNDIERQLAERRSSCPEYPHVVVLQEENLSDSALKALYRQCHCLVAPSRAEGFGLPLAEAMLSGLPAITTGWGGQLDFCNDETAWLIDFTFSRAKTHFNLYGSVWADPDVDDLSRKMRQLHEMPADLRRQRSERGRTLLLDRFRWQDVAGRLVDAARAWAQPGGTPRPRIGWVTTWNTRCGIATYSAHLIEAIPDPVTVLAAEAARKNAPDGLEVVRCWKINGHSEHEDDFAPLGRAVEERGLDTLVFQFNYSFFHMGSFARFIEKQVAAGRVLVVMLHSTVDRPSLHQGLLAPLLPALAMCHRVCVHSVADLNRLKAQGLVENVTLFPHGVLDYAVKPASAAYPDKLWTIGSYGFFLPHKGLLELIEAAALLRQNGIKVQLLMVNAQYPVRQSVVLVEQARRRVRELELEAEVRIVDTYLSDQESLALLSDADLIVFPYQETGESASGAVRYGLASGRPVAVTPRPIFDDLGEAVWRLPGTGPQHIAEGIAQILQELTTASAAAREKATEAERWREAHRYPVLGRRLHGMLVALARQRDNQGLGLGGRRDTPFSPRGKSPG